VVGIYGWLYAKEMFKPTNAKSGVRLKAMLTSLLASVVLGQRVSVAERVDRGLSEIKRQVRDLEDAVAGYKHVHLATAISETENYKVGGATGVRSRGTYLPGNVYVDTSIEFDSGTIRIDQVLREMQKDRSVKVLHRIVSNGVRMSIFDASTGETNYIDLGEGKPALARFFEAYQRFSPRPALLATRFVLQTYRHDEWTTLVQNPIRATAGPPWSLIDNANHGSEFIEDRGEVKNSPYGHQTALSGNTNEEHDMWIWVDKLAPDADFTVTDR
jgi:hypothetical protein